MSPAFSFLCSLGLQLMDDAIQTQGGLSLFSQIFLESSSSIYPEVSFHGNPNTHQVNKDECHRDKFFSISLVTGFDFGQGIIPFLLETVSLLKITNKYL